MMKNTIKKLLAALLAVAMLCAMAVPALAAGENADAADPAAVTNTGKITIDNVITGYTYKIYRILDLKYNANPKAYCYTASKAWEEFVKSRTSDLEVDSKTGVVTWVNQDKADKGAAIQDFANAAGAYAKEHSIKEDGTIDTTGKNGEHSNPDNSTYITFENLPLGWYLVVSDLNNGAICSIDTTDPNAEIKEKNSAPDFKKHILEGQEFKTANNAGIGDTVTFQIDILVRDGQPQKYVVHDKMSKGLTFDSSSVSVFLLRHSGGSGSGFINTGYKLVTDSTDDGCTFEVQFDEGTLLPNDGITIKYSATVNEKAVIAGSGNTNEAFLKYNDKTSVTHTTTTYVWEMDVHKFANHGPSDSDRPLENAEFRLYKMDGNAKKYAKFTETGDHTSIYKLNETNNWTTNEADATKVLTPANGNIRFEGLDEGTYYLEETTAPTGYNKLSDPIKVVIKSTLPDAEVSAASYTVTTGDGENATVAGDHTIRVENKTGTVLPSTGGMGTTLFYVIGGGLMVAAIVLLVTKKRMENK